MSLERLPQELILQVAGHLEGDAHTLSSLSLVSHQLRGAGQVVLHRKIKILDKSKVALMQLLRTLLERPDLVQQVKALKLLVFPEQDSSDMDTSHQFSVGQLIGQCVTYLHRFPTLVADRVTTREMET